MRPKKVEDEKLILNLMSVLRKKGYEGSSLNELAKAAGLNKASLYHRFPGGKKGITNAVLDFADEWVMEHIYNLLSDGALEPEERLHKVIRVIDEDLYNHGHEMCILRALSMDGAQGLFERKIKKSVNTWLDAFTELGKDFGLEEDIAEKKAVEVLVNIQGGLIVSEGLGSTDPFGQILNSIENLYVEA